MIYLVLNGVLFATLIWFSSFADRKLSQKNPAQFVGLVLILAFQTIVLFLSLLISEFGNLKISNFFTSIYLCLSAYFSSSLLLYTMQFPFAKKQRFGKILVALLTFLGIFLVFSKIKVIKVSTVLGIMLDSENVGFLETRWHNLFSIVYYAILPGLALVSLLLKIETFKRKLIRQQIMLLAFSILACLALYWIIDFTSSRIEHSFNLLAPFATALVVYLIYCILQKTVLFDFKYIVFTVIDFLVSFMIFGIVAGLAFGFLMRFQYRNTFQLMLIIATSAILALRYRIGKSFSKTRRSRTSNYLQHFEEDLASLDYTEAPSVLFEQMLTIFKTNVHTSKIDFYIDTTEDELVPIFSSGDQKVKIKLDNPAFAVTSNAKIAVIFRSQLATKHALSGVRDNLEKIFAETGREVMILLYEGSRIFGAILLGVKHLGNEYTDYDYSVFTRFYSYFFVIGYYFKNIANESVVGTVNREIKMSGQIIESIQSNMDFIDNPKVDVGYISVAAHNLGGEYMDFIKLTEDRHLMVFGDVSGKGINASMSAVILKSIVRTFLGETKDFKQLVSKVNVFIRDNLPKGTFFAGIFALIDFSDNTLYYINCGIPALFMYNQAYNNVIEIQGEGRVLGFVKSIDKLIKVRKIKLTPGDIILTCTDGLLDARSIRGEFFGKNRVQRAIIQDLGVPAEKMSQFLYKQLLEFTSKELEDDVSIVTLKFLSK